MDEETNKTASSGKKFAADLRELVRLEIALAKSELASKGKHAAIGVALLLVALLTVFLLIATLVTAAVLAFALVVPGWAAALVVAGLLLLVTGACVAIGIQSLRAAIPPLPKQAIQSSKESIEWLRARLKSVRK
ncbi:MAG TPA: phage holin family protein [Gaiellaceae bacterium]